MLRTRRTAAAPAPASNLKHVTRAQLVERQARRLTRGSKRAAPSGVAARNLQTYSGSVADVSAPAVYAADDDTYTTSGVSYDTLSDALNASCNAQMQQCLAAAANMGLVTGATVAVQCRTTQLLACTDIIDLEISVGGVDVGVHI
nr:uncharacterized protein CI109_006830 [Kwoniella shandongensis]KAA5524880.1 hypothetical protein CI109_006830 [Kwoniella shandongensis]